MLTPVESAASLHGQGFSCSQSVFAAFASQYGLNEKNALHIASPFGGGFARRGEICGVVTGALLVLGLAYGSDTPAGKEDIYLRSEEFMHQFEAKHYTLLCRALIDCDISTPEGLQEAKQAGKFTTICPILVRDAAELVQKLLETD